MRKIFILFCMLITCCALISNAADETIAIINAKIYTMTGAPIENGVLILKGGKIEDVGTGIQTPSGARVIDASGKTVLPGFIDSNCHVGLEEVNQVKATVDDSEAT